MTIAERKASIQELWPLLCVGDIDRSTAFYCNQLGFETVAEAKNGEQVFWRRLQRGGASLMRNR